jgi:hypothetical protein
VAKAHGIPVGRLLVAAVVLAVVAVSVRAHQPPDTRRRVALWGDSLAWEAQGPFQRALAAAGDSSVLLHTYGGTAPCDWLDDIRTQARTWHPAVAVLSFSGNAGTRCMQGRELTAAYQADVTAAVASLAGAGAHVLLVESPPRRDDAVGAGGLTALDQIWASIAAKEPGTKVVPAGAAVTAPGGVFAATLPCRAGEQCGPNGQVTIRDPDGVHFCPVIVGPMVACPVPSAGAARYGQAMAAAVIAALAAPPTGSPSPGAPRASLAP